MPIDWRLGGQGFDASQVLQSFGQAQDQQLQQQRQQAALAEQQRQRQMQEQQLAARQQAGQQLTGGDYAGATATAYGAGDLDFAKQIGGLQADKLKALRAEAEGIAGLAYSLRGVPADQRAAQAMPILQQMGVDPAAIATVDWSDNGIKAAYGWGMSVKDQVAAALGEGRIADIATDNARQDRLAGNTINATQTRLGFAANADRRGAAASSRAAQARAEGRVRFSERNLDRAAVAAGGRGVRTDLSDLDY